jgi:hypothetical protein
MLMFVIQHQLTARERTSGENLLLVCLLMAPPSQELEPPANPEPDLFVHAKDLFVGAMGLWRRAMLAGLFFTGRDNENPAAPASS